jgi:hypothetical protein
MTSVLRHQGDRTATERPTVGDIKISLVGMDHIGWLKCDNRELPIAAFRQLYDVIGDQFGTATTPGHFVLPNATDIEPALLVANLFIYSGRLFRDAPTGPLGDNTFPPNYPARIF